MDTQSVAFRRALELSQRTGFHIEDVLPDGARLDLERPFLPESLAQVDELAFLSPSERRTLNQIRGHSYLCLFGVVEEFILPFVLDHARTRFGEDDYEVRALLQFASEEAKHIQLFKSFAERFRADFRGECRVIGPARGIADAVLSHEPLGVALMTLHIEWMTQRHYVDSVRSAEHLEPLFKSLLRHHWMEEAQHARLDALVVQTLAARSSSADVQRGIADYHRIVALLESGLCTQVELDREAFEARVGRELNANERFAFRRAQERAYRDTFIASGADHPEFLARYGALARH